MTHVEKLYQYLQQSKLMQLATVKAGKPWICTVYFVADEDGNLYWLSLPTRRHSREIDVQNNVAAAIAVKQDMPVIGIQVSGKANVVTDADTVKKMMDLYVTKYATGHNFYENFVADKNDHQMYVLNPEFIVVFDEVNHPENPRSEYASNDFN